jgi:hypothetical protein
MENIKYKHISSDFDLLNLDFFIKGKTPLFDFQKFIKILNTLPDPVVIVDKNVNTKAFIPINIVEPTEGNSLYCIGNTYRTFLDFILNIDHVNTEYDFIYFMDSDPANLQINYGRYIGVGNLSKYIVTFSQIVDMLYIAKNYSSNPGNITNLNSEYFFVEHVNNLSDNTLYTRVFYIDELLDEITDYPKHLVKSEVSRSVIDRIDDIKAIFTKINIEINVLRFTLFPIFKISRERILLLINSWNNKYNITGSTIKPYFSQITEYIDKYGLNDFIFLFWYNIFHNNIYA